MTRLFIREELGVSLVDTSNADIRELLAVSAKEGTDIGASALVIGFRAIHAAYEAGSVFPALESCPYKGFLGDSWRKGWRMAVDVLGPLRGGV